MPIKLPRYAQKFRAGKYRYRILKGGRGSAKTQTIATLLLLYSLERKIRVLCGREIMETIADSSHKILKDIIQDNSELTGYFTITQNSIRSSNGSEFIFKGLRYNVTELKGLQGIDYAWIDEAENVSENSWQILIPTIRQEGSEIWISFNPESEHSATHKRFIETPQDNALIMTVNYPDNPFMPEVLLEEMENDRKRDYNNYLHIWEGQFKSRTEAQIFKRWKVEEFETPYKAEFIFGADWGFAKDPNTVNRMFIEGSTLYIDYEANGVGIEIDQTPEMWDTIPEIRNHFVRADSARPELISYMNRHGFLVRAAEKWPGSIEDGIETIRLYDVVIHPRCKHTAKEFSLYSYKTHRLTGDILPQVEDANNHHIDAIRYALEPITKNGHSIWANII
jgi:phage terminase large subunit